MEAIFVPPFQAPALLDMLWRTFEFPAVEPVLQEKDDKKAEVKFVFHQLNSLSYCPWNEFPDWLAGFSVDPDTHYVHRGNGRRLPFLPATSV